MIEVPSVQCDNPNAPSQNEREISPTKDQKQELEFAVLKEKNGYVA